MVTRLLVAGLLAIIPAVAAPTARAVTPPAVDSGFLPAPGPAAPPYPTEPSAPCAISGPTVSGRVPDRPDLRSAWAVTRGAGQTVAVIDTGVARHRLLPHLVAGGDFVSTGDGTQDCDGHGTIVAGLIGAAPDDASGFSGIAPEATIIGIRQSSSKFREAGGGAGVGDVDTLAAAVRLAADLGATVINISTVACLAAGDALDDRALGAALGYAVDIKNAVVVAAAGNVGGHGSCPKQNPVAATGPAPDWQRVEVVASPCWYDDQVLTVGSVRADGTASEYSLAGPWVDVAAPAEGVVSLDPAGEGLIDRAPDDTGAQPISGTSYAAPVVAGYVALLRSVAPHLTARQVMKRIEDTALPAAAGWNPQTGHGIVDIRNALDGVGATAPPPARPVPVAPAVPADPTDTGRIATAGAGLCLAVAVAAIATGRLRRRRDGVALD
ncbi:type VII secretion-associated serine protease mycosin [Mycolicibacterium cosmeticum]|uniref:Type VII secretion-associated serine protease mycosin n=1 Tax=Mycolicibacterium cosmeticum TaxID=258533 RepID=W9B431_MYCCO|nr:type VII secretion-associated serine protease mycosin [Mycolicibacterium cosmeticum]